MAALKKLRLSPWLIALAAAAFLLEEDGNWAVSLVCVWAHEMGHAACAEAFGCETVCIELAPFGGAVHIRGMEQISGLRNAAVALAGPAVNLMLAALCIAGARLLPEWTQLWADGLRINLTLMLFNLLPAYPMDGGRVLCALLQEKAGYARAQRLTAGAGMLLGALAVCLGAAALYFIGKINLTLVLCGGYLYCAAKRAWRETPFVCMTRLLGRNKLLQRRSSVPVRMLAVKKGTTDAQAAALLRPGALYRIVYVDDRMRICAEKWETELGMEDGENARSAKSAAGV